MFELILCLPLQGTGRLPSFYWTGLVKDGNRYFWPDGTFAGNGATSNADPYAHFPWDYQDRLTANPTFTSTLAHVSWAYDSYIGNASYSQMQSSTFYNFTSSRSKYGWSAYPPSQTAPFICEKPLEQFDCELVNAPPKLPASDCEFANICSLTSISGCSPPPSMHGL
jgi:hypothetical protein